MLKEENYQIINDSGDHKYFTMIPNFILNHSTATAQALYLQLKRLAGDNNSAYPGSRYLMKQLNISYNTLKKEMKYLIDKNWIIHCGKKEVFTNGGKQYVDSYKIIDLWEINSQFYNDKKHQQRGVKIETPIKIETPGCQNRNTGGVKIETKEEHLQDPIIELNIPPEAVMTQQDVSVKFDSNQEKDDTSALSNFFIGNLPSPQSAVSPPLQIPIEKTLEIIPDLLIDEQRHIHIMGLFVNFNNIKFENKDQQRAFIVRHCRETKNLIGFSDEKIIGVMEFLKETANYKWTISTILKLIFYPIEQLRKQNNSFKQQKSNFFTNAPITTGVPVIHF